MITRRDFLARSAWAGGVWLAGLASSAPAARARRAPPPAPLRLLVLGGTGFIGPHLVRLAASRGHRVSIFTRGRHEAELPEGIERLVGDRDGHLEALADRSWDAVIDDSATDPDWVRQSAALLRDAVGRYLFTSSTGVYYPYRERGLDETTAPHLTLADPKDGSEKYGVSKALCEKTVLDVFGDRGVVVRPTFIVGPGDTTDRFPYWPVRLARGGEVLAPGRRHDPVQFVDVRDLAAFMLRLLEERRSGIYNVAGPRSVMTCRTFYRKARSALNPGARLTFVEDYDFLAAHGIEYAIPWVMLRGDETGMMSIRNDRAVAAGLRFRPIEDTLRDTLAWWPSVPEERRRNPKFAITEEAETKALADWRARRA